MFGTLVAALDVPPIVPIAAGLIVGLLLLRYAVFPLLGKLGMKGFKIVLVIAAVYAVLHVIVTYFIASRGAQKFEDLGTREKDRSDHVLARISGLREQLTTMGVVTKPMAESCTGITPMQLDELVLASRDGAGLRATEYNTVPSSQAIVSHPRGVDPAYPTMREIWPVVVRRPASWDIEFPSPYWYLLAKHRYAMVVSGDLGALVDLEGDHLICGGVLPAPFAEDLEGDGDITRAKQVAPLAALCASLAEDICQRIKFTAETAPKVW